MPASHIGTGVDMPVQPGERREFCRSHLCKRAEQASRVSPAVLDDIVRPVREATGQTVLLQKLVYVRRMSRSPEAWRCGLSPNRLGAQDV